MAAVVVVGVQPSRELVAAFAVAGVEAGVGPLVGQGVQEVVAADRTVVLVELTVALVGPGIAAACRATDLPPSAAGGDLAQFLDIDMNEIAAAR